MTDVANNKIVSHRRDLEGVLLSLDLDGTLTNSKKKITPRTYEALMEAQRNGAKVVLASGRPVYGMEHLAEQLHLAEYGGFVLAFNGGKLIDWQTQEVIMEQKLPDDLVPRIYNSAVEADLALLTYRGKTIVTNKAFDRHVMHNAYINKLPLVELCDFLNEIEYPVNKCLIVGEPERLEALEKKMQEEYGDAMGVFRSQPFFLECVPPGIDKAHSLDVLCQKRGFKKESIVAFGDSWNDLSMIEFAGLGVAMGNAVEELKTKADYVTSSNEEDGVAEVIELIYRKCSVKILD